MRGGFRDRLRMNEYILMEDALGTRAAEAARIPFWPFVEHPAADHGAGADFRKILHSNEAWAAGYFA